MLTLAALEDAATVVYNHMTPTPLYNWPLLDQYTGCQVMVKHENHAPTGSFKARSALVFMEAMRRIHPTGSSFITATRGNHGLSLAWAAQVFGFQMALVMPQGVSPEKVAMAQAHGAFVIEHGMRFEDAQAHAQALAAEGRHAPVPAFHTDLVRGCGTYALELFRAGPAPDAIFVPIGLGNGLCGVLAARAVFRAPTRVIGVVSDRAPVYARTLMGQAMPAEPGLPTFAEGLNVTVPDAEALATIRAGVDHLVEVSDDDVAEAIRLLFRTTHNVAEGAGAAALAGLRKEQDEWAGKRVAVILCGQNIERRAMRDILAGRTPTA